MIERRRLRCENEKISFIEPTEWMQSALEECAFFFSRVVYIPLGINDFIVRAVLHSPFWTKSKVKSNPNWKRTESER